MERDVDAALRRLCDEAAEGELVFPANLDVALKLQESLEAPECHGETLVALAQAEPLIAARLVAIANSVAYTRFGGRVSHVRAAIQVIGMRPLRALVAAIVVRQIEQAIRDPALRQRAQTLWLHSVHVAAWAKVLAQELGLPDADAALFAGIVHEIEGFYLLSRAEQRPPLRLITRWGEHAALRQRLLLSVLAALKVPRPIQEAILGSLTFNQPAAGLGLADILQLANFFAPVASPLDDEIDIEARLAGSRNGGTLAEILVRRAPEIAKEVEALMA